MKNSLQAMKEQEQTFFSIYVRDFKRAFYQKKNKIVHTDKIQVKKKKRARK